VVLIEPWHDLEMPRVEVSRLVFERHLFPTLMLLPTVVLLLLKSVGGDAGAPDGLVSAGGWDGCSPNSRVELVVFLREVELHEH